MNIEIKKNKIISLIHSIADENIIDEISTKIIKLVPTSNSNSLDEYKTEIRDKFDLESLKKQQNYKSPSLSEIDKLIESADIQESIDELLKFYGKPSRNN